MLINIPAEVKEKKGHFITFIDKIMFLYYVNNRFFEGDIMKNKGDAQKGFQSIKPRLTPAKTVYLDAPLVTKRNCKDFLK